MGACRGCTVILSSLSVQPLAECLAEYFQSLLTSAKHSGIIRIHSTRSIGMAVNLKRGGASVDLQQAIKDAELAKAVKLAREEELAKEQRKRVPYGINCLGLEVLRPIRDYLLKNPNKTTKEISAAFPDLSFYVLRYTLSRAVKFGKFEVTPGYKPTYRVSPQ